MIRFEGEELESFKKFSPFVNATNSAHFIEEFNQAHFHLERNANAKILCDVHEELQGDEFGKLRAKHGFALVLPDALYENAKKLLDRAPSNWFEDAMALNLTAILLTARHTIPHLRAAGGGSIVNISSIAATRGMGSGAYAASKAAMIGLTKDWAYEHGRDGVRVNCLVVGHVFTPMGNQGGSDVRERRRLAGLLGTEGTAWDVAWPAVFLASEEAQWITGVAIPVDAGTTATAPLGIQLLNERSHPVD